MSNKSDKNSNQMQYIMYCRKSTEGEDRQILSLSAQYKELQNYAKVHNLKIVGVYKESKSAYKPGREGFNEMVARIDEGQANGILVWHANRLARNALDGAMVIHLLDTKKLIEIRTPSSQFGNESNSKFMLQLDFAMSKKSSDDNSDAVKRGNREKFNQSWWPGLAKIGYLNVTDQQSKYSYIDVDPDRFYLVQKAMKLIIAGTHTPMEALNKLNNHWKFRTIRRGKTGGRPLAKSRWYKMLSDEYYFGLMIRPEGIKMGKHKPMLTEKEFNKLQERLGKPRRTHDTRKSFPYKSILSCGECGGSVTAEEKHQIICSGCKKKFAQAKNRTTCPSCGIAIDQMDNPTLLHYIYYKCTKKVHPNCSQGSIEVNKLEAQVDALLAEYEIPEEFKEWAIKYLNEVNDQEEQHDQQVYKELKKRFEANKKALNRLLRLRISFDNADFDKERQSLYDEQENELLAEQSDIQAKLNDSVERKKNWLKLSKDTFEFACYARYWFENGDLEQKTAIMSMLGKNLRIMDKKMLIDEHKPFFLIKKAKLDIEAHSEKLEPSEKIGAATSLMHNDAVSSYWRRWWDSNPRNP